MATQPAFLTDQSRLRLAALDISLADGRYEGQFRFDAAPDLVKALFAEYEEIVEGQMFSLLDDVERRVADLCLKVLLEDGSELRVEDLQVYPTTGAISFVGSDPKTLQRSRVAVKATDSNSTREFA
jgi:hypothetical protein